MGLETDIIHLSIWVENSDRVIDNQKLLQLRTDCSNNNVQDQKGIGQYDGLIQLIEKKLETTTGNTNQH